MTSSELPPHTALCCRYDFYITPGQATQGGPRGQAYIRFVRHRIHSDQRTVGAQYRIAEGVKEQISDQTGTSHQL